MTQNRLNQLKAKSAATRQRTPEQDESRKEAHQAVIPEIQEYENAVLQKDENDEIRKNANKKRATFEFDEDFHAELKVFAARHKKKMVDVVVQAIREHMSKN